MLQGKIRFIVVFLMAMSLCMPLLAHAQTINVDQASLFSRLDRMERRLMALEQKLFASGAGSMNQNSMADYEVRLQEIERESTGLYGSVEKLGHALDRLADRLDKMSQDIEMRLQDLESQAIQPAAATAVPQIQTPAVPAPVTPPAEQSVAAASAAEMPKAIPDAVHPERPDIPEDLAPERLYKKAYNYMTAAQYPTAQIWLETFLQRYPDHELADNAYYWLGEVHLVQGKAEKAVIAFKDGLAKFPEGMKAAGNLLKMGVALQQLGQPHHARSAWKKLLNDYPNSAEASKAKALLETRTKSS